MASPFPMWGLFMTTVRDICTRALRKIGAADVAADGDGIAEALDAYNDMMHGWKILGADVAHVTQALADDFLLDDEFVEGTVYILATRLSPNYEIPPLFDADMWFRAIQAAFTTIETVQMDSGLLNMPSQRYRRVF